MDDLISRQAVFDLIEEMYYPEEECCGSDWRDGSNDTLDRISNRLCSLPSAQPESKWIPCSDVPDTDRNVFIARGEQASITVCIGHYNHDYKQWYEDRNWFAKGLYDGLYWCEMPPLPESYREEGD